MFRLACVAFAVSVSGISVGGANRLADLKVGDVAPPFEVPGSDGRTYRLADYAGKQVVVLAWFAKAFTSG